MPISGSKAYLHSAAIEALSSRLLINISGRTEIIMEKKTLVNGLALLTAAVVALSAAGCGKGKDADSSGGNKSNTSGNTAVSDIEMPTADLSGNSKVLKVFGWSTMAENNTDGEAAEYFKKEFGVTLDETVSTHETYWQDLAKMVAAGNSPDVVDLSYDKFFPTPLTGGLLDSWDGIIDFNTPLWSDTKELIEGMKWKGKIYYPVISEFMTSWLYYNKNMFRNYGLEDQNPRTLWEKGEWTMDKMIELSDQFIEKNNKNEVTQYGFTVQNLELLSMTGEQIVEIKGGTEYVNNIKSSKIAKVMNSMYKISGAGTGSFTTLDACPVFEQEKCAMLLSSATLTLETRFADLREKDALGFAPMPKLDNETPQYVEAAVDPGYGLVKGAQNVELATLWVNYLKWFRLGENFCVQVPISEETPAKQRYGLKAKAGSAALSEEDIAFINKYLESKPEKVYCTYRSIVRNMGDLSTFKWDFFSGKSQWSAVVQEIYPRYETQLKKWVKE